MAASDLQSRIYADPQVQKIIADHEAWARAYLAKGGRGQTPEAQAEQAKVMKALLQTSLGQEALAAGQQINPGNHGELGAAQTINPALVAGIIGGGALGAGALAGLGAGSGAAAGTAGTAAGTGATVAAPAAAGTAAGAGAAAAGTGVGTAALIPTAAATAAGGSNLWSLLQVAAPIATTAIGAYQANKATDAQLAAQEKATAAQQAAAQQALDFQKNVYNQRTAALSPYRNAGTNAFTSLAGSFGLSPTQSASPNPTPLALGPGNGIGAPQQAAQNGQMALMQSPDGKEQQQVPIAQVPYWISKNATRIG